MPDRSWTALVGMEGFVVLSMTETTDELFMLVDAESPAVGCPSCGVRAIGHGRNIVQVRDLPMRSKAARLDD